MMKKFALCIGALAGMGTLAGCQTLDVEMRPVTQQMEPAELPRMFEKGETIVLLYDGEREVTYTVTDTKGDVYSVSGSDDSTASFHRDFTVQPIEVNRKEGRFATKTTFTDNKDFWPMVVGNTVTHAFDGRFNSRSFKDRSRCEVMGQQNIDTKAGAFDTWHVKCDTGSGKFRRSDHWFYAPSVKFWVKRVTTGRRSGTLELVEIK